MKKGTLGIIGAGDLGQHIAHYAKMSDQFDEIIFFDDFQKPGSYNEYGLIAGNTSQIELFINKQKIQHLLIGVGYNHMDARESFFEMYAKLIHFPNLIHPSVYMDYTTKIGSGNILLPGCVIDKDSIIGNNIFLNPSCTLAHDNNIKDHSFFGPGVKTSGFVTIGKKCFIGTGTTTVDNLSIGDNISTGAGTVITKSISKQGTYIGAPARMIK